jgi:hypothetical protein
LADSTAEEHQTGGDQILSESGASTPTAAPVADQNWDSRPKPPHLPRLSSTNLSRTTVHDVSVEVVISSSARETNERGLKPDRHNLLHNALSANMIVSVWNLEDVQYYTLTFTSTGQTAGTAAAPPSSRVVNKASQLYKPQGSASSSSSSKRSATSSKVVTPTFQHPEFPPRGPPFKSNHDLSSSASIFQKASQLKDALLNCINMPAYGLSSSRFIAHALLD